MRRPALLLACGAIVLAGSCPAAHAAGGGPPPVALRTLLAAAGRSLIARHVAVPAGGWAWRSVIQRPHLQTDRDVGAASVILGLLALHAVTRDRASLTAARHAGDWLLAVARHARGGLTWPDYVDGPRRVADDRFTSFDDGAPGIADALWRLWTATRDVRYRAAALAGMRWEERVAESPAGQQCPRVACRWQYDLAGAANPVRSGIGEGNAGIAYAFDVFARRTGDARFERYAVASASYLERLITAQGAMPWGPGRPRYFVGFLSGAAGDAWMYLHLYRHTGARRWLGDAERLLAFVRGQAVPQFSGLAWPLYRDAREPGDPRGGLMATGIEEGAAGIGWVELEAWRLLHDPVDLRTAVAAGDWLLAVADRTPDGASWPEDVGVALTHTSLDNGAPGVGWFLHDLWLATGDVRYEQAAKRAVAWLEAVRTRDRAGVLWREYHNASGWHLPADPSWHWGLAGITGFLARMAGWPVDMPGEEPSLGGG